MGSEGRSGQWSFGGQGLTCGKIGLAPQPTAPESGRNPGRFPTAVLDIVWPTETFRGDIAHCTISPRRMVATGLPSTGRAEKEAALEAANLTDDLAACTVRCDRISLQRASMRWKITFNSLRNLENVG